MPLGHAAVLRRWAFALVTLCLTSGTPVLPQGSEEAEPTALLRGLLFDPSAQPAVGLRAVVIDVATRTEYTSEPAAASGEYVVAVPAGSRYRVSAALTPDGERLPVRIGPATPARIAGTYRLPDVRFLDTEEPPRLTPARSAAPSRPWYRKPGGVIGFSAGSVALILIAADRESDPATVSPTMP